MKNIYTFCVVKQEDRPGRLEMQTLFTTSSETEVAQLTQLLLERDAGFKREAKGMNARAVVAVAIDTKEHLKWCQEGGRNGLTAKPVHKGQKFRSATEASGHIGLKHNEVAVWLSRARATNSKTAQVRGVTFAYADEE